MNPSFLVRVEKHPLRGRNNLKELKKDISI
jgi:hypothetical protein